MSEAPGQEVRGLFLRLWSSATSSQRWRENLGRIALWLAMSFTCYSDQLVSCFQLLDPYCVKCSNYRVLSQSGFCLYRCLTIFHVRPVGLNSSSSASAFTKKHCVNAVKWSKTSLHQMRFSSVKCTKNAFVAGFALDLTGKASWMFTLWSLGGVPMWRSLAAGLRLVWFAHWEAQIQAYDSTLSIPE